MHGHGFRSDMAGRDIIETDCTFGDIPYFFSKSALLVNALKK